MALEERHIVVIPVVGSLMLQFGIEREGLLHSLGKIVVGSDVGVGRTNVVLQTNARHHWQKQVQG